MSKLNNLFSEYKDQELAIYAPNRALNALYLSGKTNFRLIDDNTEVHGKFLPTLQSKIESSRDIGEVPPKAILIFSRTFGERIKGKCLADTRLEKTLVLTLNDIDKSYL